MKELLLVLLAILVPLKALAAPPARGDSIVSVDKAAGLITVETSAGLKSYRLKPFTEVKLNGTLTTLDSLKPGMKVEVGLADAQTVARLNAVGNISSGFGAPTSPPPMGDLGQPTNHRITLRGKLDNDIVKVRGGAIWIEHFRFDLPFDLSINGVPWRPQWQGNISERFETFKPPLVPFGDSKVEVKKMSGRIEIHDLIPPTAENDHTLSFHIVDPPPGVAESEIRISW